MRAARAGVLLLSTLWLTAGHGAADELDAPVQVPDLPRPAPGSLAGTHASVALSPGQLARGEFSLAAPFVFPEERGPLHAAVAPHYTPGAGISEWGLGWASSLAIRRHRPVGDLDYQTDDFSSPWGPLRRGSDGAYYPAGLRAAVRLQPIDDDGPAWRAIDSAGTVYTFRHRDAVAGPRGVYQWNLSEVRDVLGRRTRLTWTGNASGGRFLDAVHYGGHEDDFQYQIAFTTAALPVPFADHRPGAPVWLDRRVTRVSLRARHAGTGPFVEVRAYELSYRDATSGPAFYLTGVIERHRSGAVEPAVSYQYDTGEETLARTRARPIADLDPFLTAHGTISPRRVSLVDIDRDGLLDIEHPRDYTLFRRHELGWSSEPLARASQPDPWCLHAPDERNPPRPLVRLWPTAAGPHVVRAEFHPSPAPRTRLWACDRSGQRVQEQTLDGASWVPSATTRLADLDRDGRPDLVRLTRDAYQVARNQSSARGIAFAVQPPGRLELPQLPRALWVHDVNGDTVADLVGLFPAYLRVWYGTGNATFAPAGQTLRVLGPGGHAVTSLADHEVGLLDANQDGLVDLLLTRRGRARLFTGRGDHFAAVPVPAFDELGEVLSLPLLADLSGSGESEVAFVHQRRAHAIRLTAPSQGLLVAVDDGRGNQLHLDYRRAAPAPGLGQRAPLLARVTTTSSGHEPVVDEYEHAAPILHSSGLHLLGHGSVRHTGPTRHEEHTFHHDDDITGLLTETVSVDRLGTGLVRFARSEFHPTVVRGVRVLRPALEESGLRATDGSATLSRRTVYESHERDVCATRVRHETAAGVLLEETLLAEPAALADALHCLPRVERWTGQHPRAEFDFRHLRETEYDPQGQPLRVTFTDPDRPVTAQVLTYDERHRLRTVSEPGRGTVTLAYEPATGALAEIIAPDDVRQAILRRDPVADLVQTTREDRGPGGELLWHHQHDPRDRLSASWPGPGPASSEQPLHRHDYRDPGPDTPGQLRTSTLATAAGGHRQTAALLAADGAELAQASLLPAGWQLGRGRDLHDTTGATTSWRGALVPTDPDRWTHQHLRRGAVVQGRAQRSGLDLPLSDTALIEAGVERDTRWHHTLDAMALVSTETTAGQLHQRVATDARGLVLWREDGRGARTHYSHDALGRLVEIELADGTRVRRQLDALGRVATIQRSDLGQLAFHYDPTSGLLTGTELLDRSGALIARSDYAHDASGRLRTERHQGGDCATDEQLSYTYDGRTLDGTELAPGQRGRLSEVRGPGFRRTMVYHPDGTLHRATLEVAGRYQSTRDTAYFPDGSPRQATQTVRDATTGATLHHQSRELERDPWGRIAALRIDGAPFAQLVYRDDGELDRIELATGGRVVLDRDPATAQPRGLWYDTGTWVAGSEWHRDPRGLVSRQLTTVGDLHRERATHHDPAGFLVETRDTDTGDTSHHDYGPSGLLLATTDHLGHRAQTRTPGQRLQAGAHQYQFDTLGRVSARDNDHFRHGPRGQLCAAHVAGQQLHFIHDEAGRRLLRSAADGAAASDPATAPDNESASELVHLDGLVLTNRQILAPVELAGIPLGTFIDGHFQLLPADHLGTRTSTAHGTPNLATPFGLRTAPLDLTQLQDYAGQGTDPLLRTVRMGLRDYDPHLGQFWTPDPLFLTHPELCLDSPVECNLWSYARNAPLHHLDPTGLGVGDWLHTAWHATRHAGGAAFDFTAGALHGAGLPLLDRGPAFGHDRAYAAGQLTGSAAGLVLDASAAALGGTLAASGAGLALATGGTLSPAGALAATGGLALTTAAGKAATHHTHSLMKALDELSGANQPPPAPRGAATAGAGPQAPTSIQRAIRSLDARLAEHRAKLAAYKENPFAFDNREDLARNAARPDVQRRIIDGRVRHLENEIRNFQQQLERLRSRSHTP
jgi:RHS repeat-associated protein